MGQTDRGRNRILLAAATMTTKDHREAAILGVIVTALVAVNEKRATLAPSLFRLVATIRWAELFHSRPGEDGVRYHAIASPPWDQPTDVELTEMAQRFNMVYQSVELA